MTERTETEPQKIHKEFDIDGKKVILEISPEKHTTVNPAFLASLINNGGQQSYLVHYSDDGDGIKETIINN